MLRCDDCVTYHVVRCHEEGVTREEFLEIFSVELVVGGSIVIPHLRRAMARLEELEGQGGSGAVDARRGISYPSGAGAPPPRRPAAPRVSTTPPMFSAAPTACSGFGRSPRNAAAVATATSGVRHM